MLSCGCRCALELIEEQLHVFQYYSIIYVIRYIFYFSCSHTIHNIPGSQYLEYVDPGNVLLVLYSFVFTGFRVDDATLKKKNGLFAPVFASIIVIVIVIDHLDFSVR